MLVDEIGRTRPIFEGREEKLDFNSLLGYLTSLATLYAWTLFAAGAFALGERVCRGLFAKQPTPNASADSAKG
jgi:hypothetical protein